MENGHVQPCIFVVQAPVRQSLHSYLLQVVSTVPPPEAQQLFGRQVEVQVALEALRGKQRFVELRAGPGEGKSTLAFQLAEELCALWGWQLQSQSGSLVAHAHVVDLRGESLPL